MEYIKYKYFILNKNSEALVFFRDGRKAKIFLPRITNEDESDFTFHLELMDILTHGGLVLEDSKFIRSETFGSPQERFKCVNNKLVKVRDTFCRKYYLTFADFDEKTIRAINDLCNDYNFLPLYMSLDELEKISLNDFDRDYKEDPVRVEENILNVVKTLKITLNERGNTLC